MVASSMSWAARLQALRPRPPARRRAPSSSSTTCRPTEHRSCMATRCHSSHWPLGWQAASCLRGWARSTTSCSTRFRRGFSTTETSPSSCRLQTQVARISPPSPWTTKSMFLAGSLPAPRSRRLQQPSSPSRPRRGRNYLPCLLPWLGLGSPGERWQWMFCVVTCRDVRRTRKCAFWVIKNKNNNLYIYIFIFILFLLKRESERARTHI